MYLSKLNVIAYTGIGLLTLIDSKSKQKNSVKLDRIRIHMSHSDADSTFFIENCYQKLKKVIIYKHEQ